MSISINSNNSVQMNTESAVAIKTAQKANNQQELEGQMALKLIQSATTVEQVAAPIGNSGHNINIKV